MREGRVIKSTGSWYVVLSEGKHIQCRLRGKFKNDKLKLTNPIAVGDFVQFELDDSGDGVIKIINHRSNYIVRKSSRNKHNSHLIASNIDQALLVVSLHKPRTSVGFIDRFLVAAESFRIPVLLVFNKIDLYRDKDINHMEELIHIYSSIGIDILRTSVIDEVGLKELQEKIQNKVSLLSGHSGVGKSSLMNSIYPELDLRVGDISTYTDKGTHTTTYAEMIETEENTFLVDTPGIKEFSLEDISKAELAHYFPEMREVFMNCKFNNCLHENEPSCAVKELFNEGGLAESRFMSYLQLLNELDT